MTGLADRFGRHGRARAATERLFVTGRLGPRRFRALQAHLGRCPDCRSHYDWLSAVKVGLGRPGHPDAADAPIPADELALLADAAVTAALRRGRPKGRRWALAAGLAGAVGAGAAAAFLIRPAVVPQDVGEFQARGMAAPSTGAGVRAFCLSPEGSVLGTVELAGAPGEQALLRCGLSDNLQFAYTYAGAGEAQRYLWVLAVDAAGAPHVYPLHDGVDEAGEGSGSIPSGLPLEAGARDLPIPTSIRLHARHHPGRYRLVAVTASRPVAAEALARLASGQPVAGASSAGALLEVAP